MGAPPEGSSMQGKGHCAASGSVQSGAPVTLD